MLRLQGDVDEVIIATTSSWRRGTAMDISKLIKPEELRSAE
jgi:hypothetical protein